jgi:hypothetical protein
VVSSTGARFVFVESDAGERFFSHFDTGIVLCVGDRVAFEHDPAEVLQPGQRCRVARNLRFTQ